MDGDPFDLVGDVLDGQFRVDAFAGEGDLSVVYRGHHIGVDATVAIKCLNLPATLDPTLAHPLVDSFREASRMHYRLARGNINIAQSIAAGQTIAPRTGTTVPYLVREWFDGESLSSELARRRSEGKKGRGIEETIRLLEPAVDGIAYAHRRRVVHLSVSPSNLFLAEHDDTRSLKVLDFGVARALNELEAELPHDSRPPTGLRVLFPSYAAPEQLDKSVGDVGPSTDVYAIALIVMEVLSDRIVMEGSETGALVDRALDVRRRPTPEAHGLRVPRNVERVLTRAVARVPDKRQRDAGEFWNDLKSAARPTPSRSIRAAGARSPTLSEAPPSLPSTISAAPPAPSPSLAPLPTPSLAPAPSAAPVQVITAKLPPPLPPEPLPPAATAIPPSPETPPPIVTASPLRPPEPLEPKRRASSASLSPIFIAVTGSITALLLVALVTLLVTWPTGRRASAVPASTGPIAPMVLASVVPTASESTPQAPPRPPIRFSAFAARRALDATGRDVARCKRGKDWGIAQATVTFGNDGSVDHILVGPPFTGTPTGQCVDDAMHSAHVPSFDGAPAVFIARFYVAPQ